MDLRFSKMWQDSKDGGIHLECPTPSDKMIRTRDFVSKSLETREFLKKGGCPNFPAQRQDALLNLIIHTQKA